MPQTGSAKVHLSHQERTATEPRNDGLHAATVSKITQVNERIRTFIFNINDPAGFKFLPGQWLDVFVPGIEKAGGFTITSQPRDALPQTNGSHTPFFELAIQESPKNPPAAWLWQDPNKLQGQEINVRVGGSFVWPPPSIDVKTIRRAIFIAGGVGINPMMSMIPFVREHHPDIHVRLLYSTKVPSKDNFEGILFLRRFLDIFRESHAPSNNSKHRIELYYTDTWDGTEIERQDKTTLLPYLLGPSPLDFDHPDATMPAMATSNRLNDAVLLSAVGNKTEAQSTMFYVCGPQGMTDEIVGYLKAQNAVRPDWVLCEKWW